MTHPRLFVTTSDADSTRSLADVRASIESGVPRTLWQQLRSKAEADLETDPILPGTPLPGRSDENIQEEIVGYTLTHRTCQRIKRAALAGLITGEDRYRESALRQIETMFDRDRWPEWQVRHHIETEGLTADLRTGTITRDIAIAYDWLYPLLTDRQRERVLDGLDRRGIEPYFQALEDDAWWADATNNWMTCIVGGMGIAGMALGDDHPRAAELVEFSRPRMERYLDVYGPDGEFNESVGYGASTRHPVIYFMARRSVAPDDDPIDRFPFPQTCRWLMHATLPPGRYAAFGDGHAEKAVMVDFVPAVARAARDSTLQWYYESYFDRGDMRYLPLELLWFDDSLDAMRPDDVEPRGRAFDAYSGLVVSRTGWDPESTPSVVYAKGGIEEGHGHHDAGQVCLDGYGERLIRDLGSPSGYPPDFFDSEHRYEYYNASSRGHNVLAFDGREMDADRGLEPEIVDARFDDDRGGFWRFDLTDAYPEADRVERTVVHLHPHTAVVLDEAVPIEPSSVSIRWHTAAPIEPSTDGRFGFEAGEVGLRAKVTEIGDGGASFTAGSHEYEEPYDESRGGGKLEQRHEPFIAATVPETERCRLLSLFSVVPPGSAGEQWIETDAGYQIRDDDSTVSITLGEDELVLRRGDQGRAWRVALS